MDFRQYLNDVCACDLLLETFNKYISDGFEGDVTGQKFETSLRDGLNECNKQNSFGVGSIAEYSRDDFKKIIKKTKIYRYRDANWLQDCVKIVMEGKQFVNREAVRRAFKVASEDCASMTDDELKKIIHKG